MRKENKKGVEYFTFEIFNQYDFLKHGFSTRKGGFSKDYYSSMNLRLGSDDSLECVKKNFDIFLDVFDLKINNTVSTNQVHGKNIIQVKKFKENSELSDGLITDLEEIGLMTFHGDCIPVFFADIKKKVVALVHSGWRGTFKGISVEMIDLMVNTYDSNLADIIVGIGPGIGECCYAVGLEVFNQFISKDEAYRKFFTKKNDKYMMDLKKIIQFDLLREGIFVKNIEVSKLCTKCNMDLFFSHRGHGLKRGGMAAIIKKVR